MSRPILFDEIKKREFVAMITVGCLRATAAEYCGVSLTTVRNAARKDPDFAERLKRAEIVHEFKALRNIGHAGEKSWRASAWLLERTIPNRYARRGPNIMTDEECHRFVKHLAGIVTELLPDNTARAAFIARFDKIVERVYPGVASSDDDDERTKWPRSVQEWHDQYLAALPFSIELDEPTAALSASDDLPEEHSPEHAQPPNRADSSHNSDQRRSAPPITNDT